MHAPSGLVPYNGRMRSLLLAASLLAVTPHLRGQQAEAVTAVGDIHGDLETFRTLLRRTGLTDESDRWIGGTRQLVQTGDFLDRGADSRRVMDLLRRLEEEARSAGGRVTVLLGNHEIMNLTGDLVSTTRAEFASYIDLEDASTREERKKRILAILNDGSPLLRSNYLRELKRVLNEESFDRFFPPGYFGHRKALRPMGEYGRWLMSHDVIHRQAGALFLHGGLSRSFGFLSPEEINAGIKRELEKYFAAVEELERLGVFDEALGYREVLWLLSSERRTGRVDPQLAGPFESIYDAWDSIVFRDDGPLWYRGLAEGNERALWRTVEEICRRQEVERIVIGHTQPKSLRVEGRFGNRVILIDTGMNQKVYQGFPSAVVVAPNEDVQVID